MEPTETLLEEFVRLARIAAREDPEFLRALAAAILDSAGGGKPSTPPRAPSSPADSSSDAFAAPAAAALETPPEKPDTPRRPGQSEIKLQAERLAARLDAPRPLMLKLAAQPIEIAAPVLRSSPVLTQDDMIGIVKNHSAEHALAIAGRWDIGPVLADTILGYANTDVWPVLLSNTNAEISAKTLSSLARQACASTKLRDAMLKRDSLPVGLIVELLETTWGDVRDELLAKLVIIGTGDQAYRIEIPKKLRQSRKFIDAAQLADKLVRRRGVDENVLVELAQKKKQLELLLCCSKLFDLDIDTALTVLTEKSGLTLATFCRAKSLGVDTFSQVVVVPNTGVQKDPGEILALLQYYKRLPVQDAIRAVKLWRESSGKRARSESEPAAQQPEPIPA